MTTISKCLTVFALVASLAFLGVVSVASIGGPSYEGHLTDPSLSSIDFETTMNEETGELTYSAATRRKVPTNPDDPNSELAVKSIAKDSKVLADVVVKARQFVARQQQQKEEALTQKITRRQQQIDEAKRLLAVDKKALEARLASLDTLLKTTQKTLEGLEQQAVDTRTKVLAKEREAARRKQEIDRLRNQVEELIADQFRLQQQVVKLENILVRLREINSRLERRKQVLIQQGAGSGSTGGQAKKSTIPGKDA